MTCVRIFVLIAFLAVSTVAEAFEMLPIYQELAPLGPGATSTFHLVNNGEEIEAIQLSMHERLPSEDGFDLWGDSADENFLIYPPQVILRPGQSQAIRISWLGETEIDKELAFRLVAEQVPVRLTEAPANSANLELLLRFVGSVYIVPKDAKAAIVVSSIEKKVNDKGIAELVMRLGNTGSKHHLIEKAEVTFTPINEDGSLNKDKAITLAEDKIPGLFESNVLIDVTRKYVMPWPEDLPKGKVQATIDVDY